MSISVNNRKLEPSLSALIHSQTGEICRLGEFHYILLETLIANADRVLSRSFLINEVWKNRVVGNNSLPTAIHALRLALGDDGKQQEIIKTVPKKGYIFSSDWIVELPDDPDDSQEAPALSEPEPVSGSEPEFEPEITEEASRQEASVAQAVDGDSITATAVYPELEPVRVPRRFAYAKPLALLFALLCAIAAGAAFYMKGSEPLAPSKIDDESRIIQEAVPQTSSINIYHVYQTNANGPKSTTLAEHLPNALTQIDATLKQKNATMALYYHTTLQRLAFDALLTNGCQNTYQLALNVDNWQGNDEGFGQLLHQEVERTLNEMPACK